MVPEINGSTVGTGGAIRTEVVAELVAEPGPPAFEAVTVTRSVEFTSAAAAT